MKDFIHGYMVEKSGYRYMILSYRKDGRRYSFWKATRVKTSQPRRKAEDMLRRELSEIWAERKMMQRLEQWELDTVPLYQPVSQYLYEWLERVETGLSPRSVQNYRNVIRQASAYFDTYVTELRQISPALISGYYKALRAEKSENTVCFHGKVLRRIFQDACDRGYLKNNPANGIVLSQTPPNIPAPYTAEEQRLLLDKTDGTEMELPVYLALLYGLRCGEICGLHWEDIDFENKKMYVHRNVVRTFHANGDRRSVIDCTTMKTAASRRCFPLHPKVEALLRSRPEEIQKGLIFPNRYGQAMQPSTLSKKFQHFLRDQNLRPIRLHDLRHSCATLMIAQGCDLEEVQAYLGHASSATTLQYIHMGSQENRTTCERMEKLLQRAV